MTPPIDEHSRAIVEGSDLPLNMPIKMFTDLQLPSHVLANISARGEPSLLESFAAPIIMAGRHLALIGAAPTGADQVAPLLLPLIGRLAQESSESAVKAQPKSPRAGSLAAGRLNLQ